MSYRDVRWQDEAACLGQPVEVFFPGRGGRTVRAKEICLNCGVKTQCLGDVLDNEDPDERFGVWGSMSARERVAAYGGKVAR